ncbi:MAG: hypothetical protein ACRCZP_13545 [Phycicoccus sp.]
MIGDDIDDDGCCKLCGGLVPDECPEPDGLQCADRVQRSRRPTVVEGAPADAGTREWPDEDDDEPLAALRVTVSGGRVTVQIRDLPIGEAHSVVISDRTAHAVAAHLATAREPQGMPERARGCEADEHGPEDGEF